MKNLDLYAKIEPLIGFYETYDLLHERYIKELKKYKVKSVLDVGCGRGSLLEKLSDNGFDATGIDLSSKMVDIAKSKKLKAYKKNICDMNEKFDAVVAVADVLNYMDKNELKKFLSCALKTLKPNGIFMADINTKHGFEDVADGTMTQEADDKILIVDALYDEKILTTHITLFEKEKDLYKKESATILQYYHTISEIKKMTSLQFIKNIDISLFSDLYDKTMLIMKKVNS